MKIPVRIFKYITIQLRNIRRCPFEIRSIYQYRFEGYIEALCDLGVISPEQKSRLTDMALNLWFRYEGRRVLKSSEPDLSLLAAESDPLPDWDSSAENCEVENVGDQVSKDSAPSRLSVRRLLVQGVYQISPNTRMYYRRLSRFWASAFVLENYPAKKRHSVCRV